MNEAPRSYFDKVGGMMFFPRMLDKIRLFSQGRLREDCHANLGRAMAGDGFCCDYLRVDYSQLKARVLEGGGTDEDILEWCYENGRRLNEGDLMIWNAFVMKLGWNDRATPMLNRWKEASGLSHRDDLQTIPDYTEVDEGRKP